MKLLKKLNTILVLSLTLSLVAPVVTPAANVTVAEAATIKLSKSKKKMKVGKSFKLKVKGTSKKASFTSSNEAIAKVNSKGKVTAIAPGKATITATIADKQFTCKVTVKGTPNPALTDAPFEAKEVIAEGYRFVIPKDWVVAEEVTENGIYSLSILPSKEAYSTISIELQKDDELNAMTAPFMQALIAQMYTEEYVSTLAQEEWGNAVVSNYALSTLENGLGAVTKVYYDLSVTEDDITMDANIATYFTVTEDCMITILSMVTPIEKITNPTVLEVADYIAQSFTKIEKTDKPNTDNEMQTVEANPFTFSAPKDWLTTVIPMDGAYLCGIRPAGANSSNVIVTIEEFKDNAPSWEELKKELTSIDEDTMSQSVNSTQNANGDTLTVTSFTAEDITFDIGPAYKISYTVKGTTNGEAYSVTQTQYVLLVNNYAILVAGTSYDNEDITEPTILEVAEMVVQTLKLK